MERTVELVITELRYTPKGTSQSLELIQELAKIVKKDIEEAEKRNQTRKESDNKSPKE